MIISSLAFDYAEDFEGLLRSIHRLGREKAALVFSMSHPLATAWTGQYTRYTWSDARERLYANLSHYTVEGLRKVSWVVDGYECYHRMFSSLINALVQAGFVIEECRESTMSDEMRAKYPETFGGTLHRPDFIFFRCGWAG